LKDLKDFLTLASFNTLRDKNSKGYSFVSGRRKQLTQLHQAISTDKEYQESFFIKEGIAIKHFTPILKKDVTSKYQKLISLITEYFECRAIWTKRFTGNLVEPIQTVVIYGFKPDVYICSKYLAFDINNIMNLEYNRTEQYRNKRRKHRRRVEPGNHNFNHARTKSSNYIKHILNELCNIWEEILEVRKFGLKHNQKLEMIYEFMRTSKDLDFGNREYKSKPRIDRAFCKKNKFVKNKIIVYRT
jgi:hypothetical protein